ncbi:hypothetical protein [Dyadobacter fanqingshengii]|uniref:Uncharacterized protein n=1 Tax=Dyadobacter fanqingshengii TaxID=2906443 RepID=A0A9X1TA27_9BACT|nr:hypothetical protein [Dyadobacter fanqingshengii]MCF0042005.1 hypothetical protein [Dyadobacter fanqingshengii]USJ36292.1 hypothetical protein NFI81_00655 [Dyadobacter fanqingshengii]
MHKHLIKLFSYRYFNLHYCGISDYRRVPDNVFGDYCATADLDIVIDTDISNYTYITTNINIVSDHRRSTKLMIAYLFVANSRAVPDGAVRSNDYIPAKH